VNRKYLVLAVAVLTGLFFYSACTKLDTTDIGSDLIPEVDNVNTFDTVFNVITDNLLYPDSTRIGGTSLHAIGNIANDAEFGETNAAAYFQVVPSSFGSHPFVNRDSIKGIDSVVLQIPFSTIYGDSNAIEQFEVFEIDQSANFKDSVYPIEGNPFPLAGGALGTKQVDFKTLNDSVFYTNYASTSSTVLDSVKTSHKLRIKLSPAWAAKFLAYDTAVEYKTDSAFRANFKGLAVMVNKGASPGARALAYFSLTGTPAATLTFYSRITKDGQIDTIAPVFSFTSRRSANLVKRFPGNNYAAALSNGNPSDQLAYIQSSPGSVITVKIPGLESLSNRVIHRAELILERIPSADDNIYPPAPLLFIDDINNAGDSTFTIRNDFVPTGQGTGYDLATLEGIFKSEKYLFNISRYVQSIVTKKLPSRTLRVYAPYATWPYLESGTGTTSTLPFFLFVNSPIGAYRVVVGGGTHPTNKMRLRIIYSKI
jgi:hypothetical protein